MKRKTENHLLLYAALACLLIGASCSKIENLIDFTENLEETREDFDKFNVRFQGTVDTIQLLSQQWQNVVTDSSAAKRELLNATSQQWQKIVESKSNMWQAQFGDKSDEWIRVASEYKDLIHSLKSVANSSMSKLKALESELPEDLRLATEDVEVTLRGSIGAATTNFFCATDAMEFSLNHDLGTILERLIPDQQYSSQNELYTFTICSVSPTTIKLASNRDDRNLLCISGYNFAPTREFEINWIDDNGLPYPFAPEAIHFLSENEITLDLSGLPDSILRMYQKLQVKFQSELQSEVAIIH